MSPPIQETLATLFKIEMCLLWLEEDLPNKSSEHPPRTLRAGRVKELANALGDDFAALLNETDSVWHTTLSLLKNMTAGIIIRKRLF